MPLNKLELPIMFSRSSDDTSLPDKMGARLINGWVENVGQKPIIRKLFGLETLLDTSIAYAVDGFYWWDAQSMAIFVINGNIYKMTTSEGAYASITGDALVVKGPVTFASNSWCLLMASGGRIVTWHVYGSPITAPGLTLATTKDKLKVSAFTFSIQGTTYSKTATDNISPGTDVIPEDKYGAVALDIDYAGTVTAVPAAANATGYDTAALAIAGIPACATDKCRIGWVTVMKSDGAFTFDTTEFDAANITEVYADNTLYSAETTKFLADSDAPTTVSHVAWMDGYFLANELNSARFWWSDADAPADWGALSFASAEGHSDFLSALHVAWLEITLFGRDSLETYYDDGSSPFSRIEGGVMERGTLAPYSIVNAAGTWVWLDKERKVITLTGRQYDHKSGPYDKIISDIVDVSGAWAVYFSMAGQSFYTLTFPTDNWTVVWNMTTDTWSEWGTWDSETAAYRKWKGKSYCYARTWDLHLLGDATTGKIYIIRPNRFQEEASSIRTLMLTAHTNHGTMAKKRSRKLLINVKRGQGAAGGAEPTFTMRHKSDNRAWSNESSIGLGLIGETWNIVEKRHGGIYKTRQYEFVHSSNSDFRLNEIEEDVESLE